MAHAAQRCACLAKFWQPMLEAKFGDRYHDVPALWFWTRFNREKGESKGECKGYIKGGYKHITDTFARVLRSLGSEIRLNTTVQSIDLDADGRTTVTTAAGSETFDQIVITLPTPQVSSFIGPAMRRTNARARHHHGLPGRHQLPPLPQKAPHHALLGRHTREASILSTASSKPPRSPTPPIVDSAMSSISPNTCIAEMNASRQR
jgi:hypothetical protein